MPMFADGNALPRPGQTIADKYVVEGPLGQGGMGAVLEVTHRVTGRRFALKWLLPELCSQSDAVDRFMREAQVAGRVDHRNVVEVYDFGRDGASFFMVMELLRGETLAARLEREGKLGHVDACRIMLGVTHGLAAAHAAGVVHRDLKPANVFLAKVEEGSPELPKLLDFGISKISALPGELNGAATRAGVVLGTPFYMAPEQLRSQPVDARTDIYALGVMLYETLGGKLPFPGSNYADLTLRILTGEPKPLAQLAPGTPPELIAIVEKAMAREAEQRFASAQELEQALRPFAEVLDRKQSGERPRAPSVRPAPAAEPAAAAAQPLAAQPSSLTPRRVAVAGVVLLGLLGLALFVLGTRSQPAARVAAPTGHVVQPAPVQPPAAKIEASAPEPAPPQDDGEDRLPSPVIVTNEPPSAPTPDEPTVAAGGTQPAPPPEAAPEPRPELKPRRPAEPRRPADPKPRAPHRGGELTVDDFM